MKHGGGKSATGAAGLNLGIIVEAKNVYTQQLCDVIKPIVYEGLFVLYDNAVNISETTNDVLYHFQNELKNVPKWNSDVIKTETTRITDACSYFNELITAVFLSNVRILTSVKLGSSNKKFQLVVPTNESFVHNVYINVCKGVFDNPYMFSIKRHSENITNNAHEVCNVIEKSISDTIRQMLPIKSILESYITRDESVHGDSDSESDSSDDELESSDPAPAPSSEYSPLDIPEPVDPPPPYADDVVDDVPEKSAMDNLFEKSDDEAVETKDIPLCSSNVRGMSEEDPVVSPKEQPITKDTTFFDD